MNDTSTRGDIRIAGSGTVATGVYRDVTISGSATFTGDIDCVKLKVSGSANGHGSLKAETITVSGSLGFHGDVESGATKVSGSGDFGGSVRCGTFSVSGAAEVGRDMSAESVEIHGFLQVGGDCEAERFTGEGGFKIGGLLNAGVVDLRLHAPCSAREIGGEAVVIRTGPVASLRRLVALFVPSQDLRLTVDTIEGDDIRLERTTARVVRGRSVVIGPECDVGLVEYAESYSASTDAKVKESRKAAVGSEEPRNEKED